MPKPSGVISPAQAKSLCDEFDSRHTLISNNIVNRPDNRSAWWSLKDMRDYLDYVEAEVAKNGHTMDGVRVYVGAYPEVKEVVGYTTMFLAPTEDIGGVSHDIVTGECLNDSPDGNPPYAKYPQ